MASVDAFVNTPLAVSPALLLLVIAVSVLVGLLIGWSSQSQSGGSKSETEKAEGPKVTLVSAWDVCLRLGDALWAHAQDIQNRHGLSWPGVSGATVPTQTPSALPNMGIVSFNPFRGDAPFRHLTGLFAQPGKRCPSVGEFGELKTTEEPSACGKITNDEGSSLDAEQLGEREAHESSSSKDSSSQGARPRRARLQEAAAAEGANWVCEDDLEEFCVRLEGEDRSADWSHMSKHETKGLQFEWWRRDTEDAPTEYKLRSVWENCPPELIRDFYWDDPHRMTWDPMLSSVRTVAQCPKTGAQIVHWVRKFPLFCKDREYVMARRIFSHGNTYYCVTKGIEHPDVTRKDTPRRIDVFRSCWRISPLPGNRSECLLLHQEDLGIQKDLAKFAVKHGMWGAVRKSSPGLRAMQSMKEKAPARAVSWADLHTPILPKGEFGLPGRSAVPALREASSSAELRGGEEGEETALVESKSEESRAGRMKRWVSFPDMVGRSVDVHATAEVEGEDEGVVDEHGLMRWSISDSSTPDAVELDRGTDSSTERTCSLDSGDEATEAESQAAVGRGSREGGADRVVRGLMALERPLNSASHRQQQSPENDARSKRRRRLGWIVGTSVLAVLCGVETGLLVKILLANAVKHAIFSPDRSRRLEDSRSRAKRRGSHV